MPQTSAKVARLACAVTYGNDKHLRTTDDVRNVKRKSWQIDASITASPLVPEQRVRKNGSGRALDFFAKASTQARLGFLVVSCCLG